MLAGLPTLSIFYPSVSQSIHSRPFGIFTTALRASYRHFVRVFLKYVAANFADIKYLIPVYFERHFSSPIIIIYKNKKCLDKAFLKSLL